MPEKSSDQHTPSEETDLDKPSKFTGEITQTDKLNQRLLSSCLSFINSERSNLFNSVHAAENSKKDSSIDDQDDIEKVIEGGEDGKNNESEKGSENEEENKADEDDKEKVKVKIRKRLGPRPTLNAQRLKGPRGLGIMESFFSDIKLHGKGREKEDLDLVMGKLEHWTHRLFPRMQYDDSLKKIEKLGSKKEVNNYLKRIRLGMEEDTVLGDEQDDPPESPPPPADPFDQLLTSTSAPAAVEMTTEQREQMLRNRLLAEERRAARIKRAQEMKEKFQTERILSQTANSQPVYDFIGGNQKEIESFQDVNESNTVGDNIESEIQSQDVRVNCEDGMEIDEFNDVLGNKKLIVDKIIDADDISNGEQQFNAVSDEQLDIQDDVLIENNKKQPDSTVINKVQPDVIDRNSNQHQNLVVEENKQSGSGKNENQCKNILEGSAIELDTHREINESPSKNLRDRTQFLDILQSNENNPDILRERNETHLMSESGEQPDILRERHQNPNLREARNEYETDRNEEQNPDDSDVANDRLVHPDIIEQRIGDRPMYLSQRIVNPPDILTESRNNPPDVVEQHEYNPPDLLSDQNANPPDVLNS